MCHVGNRFIYFEGTRGPDRQRQPASNVVWAKRAFDRTNAPREQLKTGDEALGDDGNVGLGAKEPDNFSKGNTAAANNEAFLMCYIER